MRAPLVPLALALATGIWLGLQSAPPAWLGPAAGGLLLLAALAAHRRALASASAGVLVVVVLTGWARIALPDPQPPLAGLRPGPTRLEGWLAAEPEVEGPSTRVPLWLEAAVDTAGRRPARGLLTVVLYGPAPALAPLDRVAVDVRLAEARPFWNPGGGPGLGAERAGPRFQAVGRSEALERLAERPPPWWLAVRAWEHRVVQRHLPPVSAALLEGLLIGERRALPPTLTADFRAAGVFHLLAISGFNVGLVAGAVLLLLRLLRVPAGVAAGLALLTLLAFAAVVGGQASVLRATVMASLVLAGQLLGREAGAWNSLAAALIVLLAWEPAALGDPGLQLSFAATAGILWLSPAIRGALPASWPGAFTLALAVSAGAQLGVSPLMLLHWNQLSPGGVVANLLVVPLAAALTVLGLVAVLLAAVAEPWAHALFQSVWLLLLALRLLVRAFAAVPGALVYLPASPPALAAASLALLLAPFARTTPRRIVVGALVALGVAATVAAALPDGRLHLVALDVGQGDALLVLGPDGRALLVDTGRADRGERVVLPALRRAGVWRLAALVVTHGDPDHAGGAAGVLDGIPVDAVLVPAGTEHAEWHAALLTTGVPVRTLRRGDRLWLGPLCITALHPPAAWSSDANNGSLVLRVEWGLASVVLAADAETPAEESLRANGTPLRAAVLKVGHHGSSQASSGAFLGAVRPRVAVVSVGARNAFGHPSPAVLGRLAAAAAGIYRTDYDGAIEIVSDGERLSIRRWARPQLTEEWLLRAAP